MVCSPRTWSCWSLRSWFPHSPTGVTCRALIEFLLPTATKVANFLSPTWNPVFALNLWKYCFKWDWYHLDLAGYCDIHGRIPRWSHHFHPILWSEWGRGCSEFLALTLPGQHVGQQSSCTHWRREVLILWWCSAEQSIFGLAFSCPCCKLKLSKVGFFGRWLGFWSGKGGPRLQWLIVVSSESGIPLW